jgi:hypothetical protein
MAIYLNNGLQASVFSQGYTASAATPPASPASPQASGLTVGQKAFGIVTGGGGGPRTAALGCIGAGVFSLLALTFIYWSLPR